MHRLVIPRGRAGSGNTGTVEVLEAVYFALDFVERVDAADGSFGGRERGDAGDVVADGGAANGFFVVEGFAAKRGVDDQIDFSGFDEVDDIGTAFVDLEDFVAGNAGSPESGAGAASGDELEAESDKFLAEHTDIALVAVIHANKDGAAARKFLTRGELGFGESLAVVAGDAHDFAGGAHFGAENGVDAAEFVEGEDRGFHGEIVANGDFGDAVVMDDGELHVREAAADHEARGNFCERNAGGFADVRNGARSARVDFEDVDS